MKKAFIATYLVCGFSAALAGTNSGAKNFTGVWTGTVKVIDTYGQGVSQKTIQITQHDNELHGINKWKRMSYTCSKPKHQDCDANARHHMAATHPFGGWVTQPNKSALFVTPNVVHHLTKVSDNQLDYYDINTGPDPRIVFGKLTRSQINRP